MTPEQIKSMYRRMLDQHGETVIIRRYTGGGLNRPKFEVEVKARVQDYQANELVGSIVEGDRRLILLVQDMIDAGFPLNLNRVANATDEIVVRNRPCKIIDVDDNTRRDAGVLIAYELQVRG